MNKGELIEAIAKETELSKAAAGRALEAVLSTIVKTVAKKQDVQLIGFGTFKAAKRAARTGRNPRTGQPVPVPAKRLPFFKVGKELKEIVNESRHQPITGGDDSDD